MEVIVGICNSTDKQINSMQVQDVNFLCRKLTAFTYAHRSRMYTATGIKCNHYTEQNERKVCIKISMWAI